MGSALGRGLGGRGTGNLLLLLGPAGLLSVCLLRLLPLALPVAVGLETPPGWAVLALAAALLPFNLLSGALFPGLCRLHGAGDPGASGRFYRCEALGWALGGLLFTLVLAGRLRGLQIAAGASSAALLGSAALLWGRRGASRAALALGCLLAVCAALPQTARVADDLWWRSRLPGFERLRTLETPYQRLDLAQADQERSVLSNGVPLFSLGDTQEAFSGARMADFFLSLHPSPRRVLVVGEGEPGLARRLAERGLERLMYALADEGMRDLLRGPDGLPEAGVVGGFSRSRLRAWPEVFDLIVLDVSAPVTAAGNRFFTVEAFEAAKARLAPDGVLAFRLPSSAEYLEGEPRLLLASVKRALDAAFGESAVLCGEQMVFVAGQGPKPPPLATLAARSAADARGAVEFRALYGGLYDAFRSERQLELLSSAGAPANRDARPVAYAMNLRRWLREMGVPGAYDAAQEALSRAARLWAWWPPLLLAAALAALRRRSGPRMRRAALAAGMLVSGFAGLAGELVLVYSYQSVFGDLYRAVGALFAAYMLGLAAGSLASTRFSGAWPLVALRALLAASCGFAWAASGGGSAAGIFAAVFAYAAVLGAEFPIAARVYQAEGGSLGVLYGLDNAGAALACLVGGTLLLPVLGTSAMLGALAAGHVVVLGALCWLL